MDITLIELPFGDITRPSLGLSILKSAAVNDGFTAEILYGSLRFAANIDEDVYSLIASMLPQQWLLGDRVFLPHEKGTGDAPELEGENLPPLLAGRFYNLQEVAARFIEKMANDVVSRSPALVGFTTMFQTVPSIVLAAAIKKANPKIKTVVGGANCEGEMGEALFKAYPQFDFLCNGPGEVVLPRLIEKLKSPCDEAYGNIPGLLWRHNGEVMVNGGLGTELALDEQPLPDFDDWLEQREQAFPATDRRQLWLPLESSRGCWWGQKRHCVFCGLNGRTMKFRRKSPGRFIKELEATMKYGIRNIYTTDLIFPHDYYDALLPKLTEHPASKYYSFFYEIKSNVRREQLRSLAGAGIRWLQPGIEALDSEILARMDKGVRGIQQVLLLKWAAEIGISLTWNILYGIPDISPLAYDRVTELIPKLTHLSPPSSGCIEIRIDRFSPMHEHWNRFSSRKPIPARAYGIVHPGLRQNLDKIAYHFEYEERDHSASVESMIMAVRKWEGALGKSSFLHWTDENGNVELFDTRFEEHGSHHIITGSRARLYLLLGNGREEEKLVELSGMQECELQEELRIFQSEGWTVFMDGLHLALSCDYSSQAAALPSEIKIDALHVLHSLRMQQMWKQGAARRDLLSQFSKEPA